MEYLPVPIGPLSVPEQLLIAWRHTISLLEYHPERRVAHTMAGQALATGHDEWRMGGSPHPAILEITELALHLETPDGSPDWRARQWARIEELLGVR